MAKVSIGDSFVSGNGAKVFIVEDSHIDHDVDSADLTVAIAEMVFPTPVEGDRNSTKAISEFEADHVVGLDGCIATNSDSNITFSVRGQRPMASRMVVAEAQPTNSLVVICFYFEGRWVLATAYAGHLAPREPWSRGMNETEQAEADAFWATHALVTDKETPRSNLIVMLVSQQICAQFEEEALRIANL